MLIPVHPQPYSLLLCLMQLLLLTSLLSWAVFLQLHAAPVHTDMLMIHYSLTILKSAAVSLAVQDLKIGINCMCYASRPGRVINSTAHMRQHCNYI